MHASHDGGRSWPQSLVVYHGYSAYSDMSLTRDGNLAVLFEKDGYNSVAFGIVPLPLVHSEPLSATTTGVPATHLAYVEPAIV